VLYLRGHVTTCVKTRSGGLLPQLDPTADSGVSWTTLPFGARWRWWPAPDPPTMPPDEPQPRLAGHVALDAGSPSRPTAAYPTEPWSRPRAEPCAADYEHPELADPSAGTRSAQVVVRWHAVRDTGINRPELGVEVCRQLLGAPLGRCR
jgi:hypothetical protein